VSQILGLSQKVKTNKRPFDAVEGATALSATRFHFMWTCVSADSPSSAPLLSPYFPFFH